MKKSFLLLLSCMFLCGYVFAKDCEDNEAYAKSFYDIKIKPKSRGYRGFVEAGAILQVRDNVPDNYTRSELTTTHGYQFNPYIFFGAGVGVSANSSSIFAYPLLAAKINFINGPISPYFDFKLGTALPGRLGNIYMAPTVGVRFMIGEKSSAINLGIGYVSQFTTVDIYAVEGYVGSVSKNLADGLSVKIGVEF